MKPAIALMPFASMTWPAVRGGAPGGHGLDLAAAHDDRAALDDRAVADDDVGVRDREVLGRERRDGAERQAGRQQRRNQSVFMSCPPRKWRSSYTAAAAAGRPSAPRTGRIDRS